MRRFTKSSVPAAVAMLGFLAPALVDLCSSWRRRPFGWVAADTFYYLTVARNVVRHGKVAYDQVHPNNGFHPLWQLVCTGLAALFDRPPAHDWLLFATLMVGVLFVAASIPFLAKSLTASGRRVSVLFPLLPVGAYTFLILPVWARGMPTMARQNSVEGPMPIYGTLWSDANGMETCLVVFFFALAGWMFAKQEMRDAPRRAFWFGLVLSAIVLARLDSVLLLLPLVAWIVLSTLGTRGWTKALSWFVGAFTCPIALYVLLNHHFYGALVPASGSLKSSFPHFDNKNIDDLVTFWKSPWRGLFLIRAYRQFAALVPAFVAVVYLAVVLEVRLLGRAVLVRLRPFATRYDAFLALVAPGVVFLALYNVLFVDWFYQGHWYFPVSTLFVSLVVLSLAAPLEAAMVRALARRLEWRPGALEKNVLWAAWHGLALFCVVVVFVRYGRQLDYHRRFADFYFHEAPKVRAYYGSAMPKFLEDDDGIVAYALGAPTMSMGLGLDPEGAAALVQGDLLTLALDRGYDRLTSVVYVTGDKLGTHPSQAELRRWARAIVKFDEAKPYGFALDYRSTDGHFAIVRAWKE